MGIRFINQGESRVTSSSRGDNPPIQYQDWEVKPVEINVKYEKGGMYPLPILVSVKFPEAINLDRFNRYRDFNYIIEVIEKPYDFIWLRHVDSRLEGNEPFYQAKLHFRNLDKLPEREVLQEIKYQVFGTPKSGGAETLIEERIQLVKITSGNHTRTENEVYDLTYNIQDKKLTGDKFIKINGFVPVNLMVKLKDEITGLQIVKSENSENTYEIKLTDDAESIFNEADRVHLFEAYIKTLVISQLATFKIRVRVINLDNNFIKTSIGHHPLFCLDKHKVYCKKQAEETDRLEMVLEMEFDYGKGKDTIIQSYEYVFFNGYLEIDPGEEIHDFFKSLNFVNIEDSDFKLIEGEAVITPKYLFHPAVVKLNFYEKDAFGNVHNSHEIANTIWLPGAKPLAYPYLTNGMRRKTYAGSKMTFAALSTDFIERRLNMLVGPLMDLSSVPNEIHLMQINYSRALANINWKSDSIIEHEGISLHPIADPDGVINVFFENQNKVPDWFTFTEIYEIQPDLKFSITPNLATGNEEKTNVVKEKTIKLNTGWFRREEFELLDDLMSSSLCYIELNGKWIKAIPTTNKPLSYKSDEMLQQQIVEFKLLED